MLPYNKVIHHVWLASLINAVAFGQEPSVLHAQLDTLAVEEAEHSVCLLQKDISINAGVQPAGYDGPWVNPEGYDQWEKQYISDPIHGDYFKNPVYMGPSTTVNIGVPQPAVTVGPTDSPVDSLAAPAPAPVPQLASGQALWQHCSWSAALYGIGTLWIVFYLITSSTDHKGRQSTTQYILSQMFAVFCAKLSYAAVDLLTAASLQATGWSQAYWLEFLTVAATKEALFVRLLLVGFLYALVHILLFVVDRYFYYFKMRALIVLSDFGAAIIGFALVDACAVCFRFNGVYGSTWKSLAVAAICALILISFAYLATTLIHGERPSLSDAITQLESEAEHCLEARAEFDTTMVVIPLGFVVFKIIEDRALRGHVMRGALGVESNLEIFLMLVAAAFLVLLAFGMSKKEQDAAQQSRFSFHTVFGHRAPSRIADLVQASLLVSAGWCVFYALFWCFSSSLLQADMLQTGFSTPSLYAALIVSAIALGCAIILGSWYGATDPLFHKWFLYADHMYWNLVMALGFVMGLAWATCFVHGARDLSTLFPNHPHIAEASICLALVVFILPFWIDFILPLLEHPMSKAERFEHGAENLLHRATDAVGDAVENLSHHSGDSEGMLARMARKAGHASEQVGKRLRGQTEQQ